MADLLWGLNPEQKQAVVCPLAPTIILAPAGSGKTKVLVTKIARLVQTRKLKGSEIVAMTFTRKAAKEMKERATALVGEKIAKDITISTSHSWCIQALRKVGKLKKTSLVTSQTQLANALTIAISNAGMDDPKTAGLTIGDCVNFISLIINFNKDKDILKNRVLTKDTPDAAKDYYKQLYSKGYKYFNKYLKSINAMTMDDIIPLTVKYLREDPEFRESVCRSAKFVIVDECQDNNVHQMELAFELSSIHKNWMFVGDVLQSIYEWRGAAPQKFNDLILSGKYNVINLKTNYRSTQTIIATANKVRELSEFVACEMEAHNQKAALCPVLNVGDYHFAMLRIKELIANQPKLEEFAILARSVKGAFMQGLLLELRTLGIKYDLRGGGDIVDSPFFQLYFCFFRVTINYKDNLAWSVILLAVKGVGPVAAQGVLESIREKTSLPECLSAIASCKIATLLKYIAPVVYSVLSNKGNAKKAVEQSLVTYKQFLDICSPLKNKDEQEARTLRFAVLERVLSFVGEENIRVAFDKLLTERDSEQKTAKDKIIISTIHQSKGLEFDNVCVLTNMLPNPKNKDSFQEDLRLFYVAVTRARHKLTLVETTVKGNQGPHVLSYFANYCMDTLDLVTQVDCISEDEAKRRSDSTQETKQAPETMKADYKRLMCNLP